MATLDDLFAALYGWDAEGTTRATSLRLPEHVHRAALIATELGMDDSLTAATTEALLERMKAFARERALASHFEQHPEDIPALGDVAQLRVSGSGHPASTRHELVRQVADWYERNHADWATSGRVDETVDRVLETVEVLTALDDPGVRDRSA